MTRHLVRSSSPSRIGRRRALLAAALGACATAIATAQTARPTTGPQVLKDAASLAAGKAIFTDTRSLCTTCHKADLGGLVGPNLTDGLWLHGCAPADIIKTIKTGYPERGMMPFGGGRVLNDRELLQVASYILSTRGTKPVNPKPADPARDKACQ